MFKHQAKPGVALLAAIAASFGLVGGVASLSDHDREAIANMLLAGALVAAVLHSSDLR